MPSLRHVITWSVKIEDLTLAALQLVPRRTAPLNTEQWTMRWSFFTWLIPVFNNCCWMIVGGNRIILKVPEVAACYFYGFAQLWLGLRYRMLPPSRLCEGNWIPIGNGREWLYMNIEWSSRGRRRRRRGGGSIVLVKLPWPSYRSVPFNQRPRRTCAKIRLVQFIHETAPTFFLLRVEVHLEKGSFSPSHPWLSIPILLSERLRTGQENYRPKIDW